MQLTQGMVKSNLFSACSCSLAVQCRGFNNYDAFFFGGGVSYTPKPYSNYQGPYVKVFSMLDELCAASCRKFQPPSSGWRRRSQ